jgi:PPP family 3-phenylpropionic acid transporter
MQISVIFFLLYAVGSVIYAGFPIVLRNMGYASSQISFLFTFFEITGLVIPLALSAAIEKSGKYGRMMLLISLPFLLCAIPFVAYNTLAVTLICLAGYAAAYKSCAPVSDSIATTLLAPNVQRYGAARAMGSLGFVVMSLLLQFCVNLKSASRIETITWFIVPAILFSASIIFVPGVFKCESETPREIKHTHIRRSLKEFIDSGFAAFRGFSKHDWAGILLIFLSFLGLTPANRLLSLYVEDYLQVNASSVMWAVSAAAEIPAMILASRFIKAWGVTKTMSIAAAAMTIRLLLYVLIPNIYGAMAAQLLHFFNYGLMHPAAVYFVTHNAPRGKLMISLSIYALCANNAANILGCVIGGIVIDKLGFPALFISFSIMPVAALIVYNVLRRRI